MNIKEKPKPILIPVVNDEVLFFKHLTKKRVYISMSDKTDVKGFYSIFPETTHIKYFATLRMWFFVNVLKYEVITVADDKIHDEYFTDENISQNGIDNRK
jgi:hypothetical protein